jgi:RNA polymerase-interacting CarD/CdnL/TRCF family regulator
MSDLVNHSMAVADLIKQQKQQERNVPEKRSLS